MIKKELSFTPYNKKFPEIFKKEKKKLEKLGKCEIHHVGSSAIPKMPGKGAIDILILVKSQKEKKILQGKLLELNYLKGKTTERGRSFFWKIEKHQEYCIHLMLSSNSQSNRQIIFRDFILDNPQEFRKYLELKRYNFKEAAGDRRKYRLMKESYFKNINNQLNKFSSTSN